MAKCQLCNSDKKDDINYGEFLEKRGVSVHTFCLYLSSGLVQNGKEDDGFYGFLPKDITIEAQRVKKLPCCYCHKPYANIGCCEVKCRRSFHFICGIKNGAQNQFVDTFRSYCHAHLRMEYKKPPSKNETCCICYDHLLGICERARFPNVIKAPCCRNGWFHKNCLQHFASSAGYFFKCPLCNNKDRFREKLPYLGIFIRDRDAEWELEPNAFAELLERPNKCSAEVCANKDGREANSEARDPLLYCNTCGSVAIHKLCLAERTTVYNCSDCASTAASINSNIDRDSGRESFEANDEHEEDVDVCNLSDTSDIDSFLYAARKRKGAQIILDNSDDEEVHSLNQDSGNDLKTLTQKDSSDEESPVTNAFFNRNRTRYNVINNDDDTPQKSSALSDKFSSRNFHYESSDTNDTIGSKQKSRHHSPETESESDSDMDVNEFTNKATEILMRKRKISDSNSSSNITDDVESESDTDPLEDLDKALKKRPKLLKRRENVPFSYKIHEEKKTSSSNRRFSDSSNSTSDQQYHTDSSSNPMEISCIANRTRHRKPHFYGFPAVEYIDSPKQRRNGSNALRNNFNEPEREDRNENILEISCIANRTRHRKSIQSTSKRLSSIAEDLEPSSPNSFNISQKVKGVQKLGHSYDTDESSSTSSVILAPRYKIGQMRHRGRRLISTSTDEGPNDDDAMKNR